MLQPMAAHVLRDGDRKRGAPIGPAGFLYGTSLPRVLVFLV